MGIKLKVTLWYTLLMALLCTLALLLINRYVIDSERDELNDILRAAVAQGVIGAESNEGSYEIEDDDDIAQFYPQVALFLYDEKGELLFGKRERFLEPFREGDIWEKTLDGGEAYLALDRPVTLDGRNIYVRGVTEKRYASAGIAPLRLISAIALPFLVALGGTGGYLLTRRAFRPVAKISEAASRITKSRDFSLRVEGGKARDELGALAEAIDGMLEELEKAYEAERRLTADASHELRTPLAGILLQCENALAAQDLEKKDEALERIRRSGKDMSALLTKLLLLARMDANAQRLETERLNFSELIDTCVEEIRQSAPDGVSFDVDIEPELCVRGDQSLLIRLLMNLLENAVRYGGENGNIRVAAKKRDGEIALCVQDDGPGISDRDLPHVFDRFYRADGARQGKGTGLGLALVKSIAQMHGARVEAESVPGIRTEFRVTMPRSE